MPDVVRIRVSGDHALFTRPELKAERVSYDVMTPSAARGLIEAIHWKPAIRWVVERIHVLAPIRFRSIRRNEVAGKIPASAAKIAMKSGRLDGLRLLADEDRTQRAALVLSRPDYVIEVRAALTASAGAGESVTKHHEMLARRAARGQCFHQPCLGTREFAAAFSLVAPGEALPRPAPEHRTPELGFGVPRDLGLMLWDIDFDRPGKPSLYFRARLSDGIVEVPPSDSPEVLR